TGGELKLGSWKLRSPLPRHLKGEGAGGIAKLQRARRGIDSLAAGPRAMRERERPVAFLRDDLIADAGAIARDHRHPDPAFIPNQGKSREPRCEVAAPYAEKQDPLGGLGRKLPAGDAGYPLGDYPPGLALTAQCFFDDR